MVQTGAAPRVRWRGILVYLLLAFGLAWIPFLALQSNTNPVVQTLILLLQFSPAIAAALVRGPLLREGFADSHRPSLHPIFIAVHGCYSHRAS